MELYTLFFANWSIWTAIVIGTSIWMGYDSAQHRIAVDSKPYGVNNGAAAWVISGLLLWIATFPFYLYRRAAALARAAAPSRSDSPPASSIASELQALHNLREAGIIHEDEYQRAKAKLLS